MSLVPPVTRDAWSYSGNDLYVEVTGNNRHRRATVHEIRAVLDGSDSTKDRPGHWYEAQLIHYGLPPSKTKGTAKMRLFDALNKGSLTVPPHISKLESDMKKEWAKRARESKQATKNTAPAKGTKRKADDAQLNAGSSTNVNINLTVSIGPHGNAQAALAAPAPKKAKTTKKAAPAEKPSKAKANSKGASASTKGSPAKSSSTTSSDKRRGQGHTKKTATDQLPRVDATPSRWDSYDDPPPPYPGSPGKRHDDSDGGLPPLGLLNGRYRVRCTGPPQFKQSARDSGIIFTLDGSALWGSFEIGPLVGILRLDERPWQSSLRPLYFRWRGEDDQGVEHAETNDGSYLKFLGDGRIAGEIGFHGWMLEFEGCRVSGQGTRSEISVASMRRQWEERRL